MILNTRTGPENVRVKTKTPCSIRERGSFQTTKIVSKQRRNNLKKLPMIKAGTSDHQ